MVAPNLAGMREALERKRLALGEDVVFHFRVEKTWPEGTVLNPQNGKPFDPAIEPIVEEVAEPVTKTCSVAFRPNFQEDTDEDRIGNVKMNVCLIWLPLGEEWEEVKDAVSFDVKGDNFLIRKVTEDGIGEDWRMLIWGERQGEPGG